MLFNLFLTIIFLVSAGTLWYRISVKIPELIAISDTVIVERLHEDSAKVRIFLLQFKTLYREKRYRVWLWRMAEKIIYRLHIMVLRLDNSMVAFLGRVRSAGGIANGVALREGLPAETPVPETPPPVRPDTAPEYWDFLRQAQEIKKETRKRAYDSPVARPRAGRMQEVRVKKSHKATA